jgi:hypothetical protein
MNRPTVPIIRAGNAVVYRERVSHRNSPMRMCAIASNPACSGEKKQRARANDNCSDRETHQGVHANFIDEEVSNGNSAECGTKQPQND